MKAKNKWGNDYRNNRKPFLLNSEQNVRARIIQEREVF